LSHPLPSPQLLRGCDNTMKYPLPYKAATAVFKYAFRTSALICIAKIVQNILSPVHGNLHSFRNIPLLRIEAIPTVRPARRFTPDTKHTPSCLRRMSASLAGKFIFSVETCIFRLKTHVSSLGICISRLEIKNITKRKQRFCNAEHHCRECA